MKIFEWINAKLNIRFVGGSLPCGHECTIVAMNISNKLEHNEREQAMFVAGFQAGSNYIKQFGNVR